MSPSAIMASGARVVYTGAPRDIAASEGVRHLNPGDEGAVQWRTREAVGVRFPSVRATLTLSPEEVTDALPEETS